MNRRSLCLELDSIFTALLNYLRLIELKLIGRRHYNTVALFSYIVQCRFYVLIVVFNCAHLTQKFYELAVVADLKPGLIADKSVIQGSRYLNADIYRSAAHIGIFDLGRFDYIGLI